MSKSQKAPDPKKPAGISLAAIGPLEVSIEIPGVMDPETGEPAVITFLCDRPSHGQGGEVDAAQADVKARGGDPAESVIASLAVVVSSTRGLSDFPERSATETREAYRERFVAYMLRARPNSDMICGAALNRFGDLMTPPPSFRHFPR